ncbi:MAG: exo-rhamnogalacturonan lyase family protein, partial [Planctomycetota bacterium]
MIGRHTGATTICLAGLAVCALAPSLRAVEVKLEGAEAAKAARAPAVVTSGIPFARGVLKDVSRLSVKVDGKALPAQFAKTVPWDDGSVRWALMDAQVELPASGKVELTVTDSGGNPAPASPAKVAESADAVTVSTGPLVVVLGRKKPGLISSLKVDGKELLTSSGKGLVLVKAGGGEVLASPPAEVLVEHAGPMRVTVCLRGTFPGVHKGLLRYTARVSAFAGLKHVKVHLWLENHGADGQGKVKPEWFAFDGMAVDLGLELGEGMTARCEGVEGQGELKVLQLCLKGKKSPHFTDRNLEYVISGPGGKSKKGERTDGIIELKGSAGKMTAGVRHFWQNCEKAIEVRGGSLRLWLWPTEGQWPRPTRSVDSSRLRR